MRTFDYQQLPRSLADAKTMALVAAIHEHKGRQDLFIAAKPDVLATLCEVAKVQSIESSNRIEGIRTTGGRLKQLAQEKTTPRNRDEQEIAGYRDVLALIHDSYDFIEPTPNVILQLHRNLMRHTPLSYGGHWKDVDNSIVEIGADGVERVRFQPPSAVEVPEAIEQLCSAFRRAVATSGVDRLLLDAMFVFDFVSIHPFNDGNGRMSRLLTLLLLYRSGYIVGKYISLERIVEQSKESYYDALAASSSGWDKGENDYASFVHYLLGCVLAAYREFESRVEGVSALRMSKPERVAAVFDRQLGRVTKADILAACPDISETTVKRALADLLARGVIEKHGSGRGSFYAKKGE